MKKFIYIMGICLIFFTFLLINNRGIKNKYYYDYKNNINVYYPLFADTKIDDYLTSYLSKVILEYSNKATANSSLYIDYDLVFTDNQYNLSIYTYQNIDNVIKKKNTSYIVDTNLSTINKTSDIKDTYFDIINLEEHENNNKYLALTFDDGPNHNTSKILECLINNDAKATFFILGTNIKGNENIINALNEAGMEIGNHTYSHKLLTGATNEEIEEEVNKTNELLKGIIGKYPTLVRLSYGSFSKKIRESINMPIIIWNVDTLDWKCHNSKKIISKILKNSDDGDIILMHDIYSATANAVCEVLPLLKEQGYELVTVSELFYYKEISLENGKVYGNA